MKLPEFTAEASLYRTKGRYRGSNGNFVHGAPTQGVVLTGLGSADEALCSGCLEKCAENLKICVGIAAATALFCPPCAAAALGECDTQAVTCAGYCHLPGESCCPEFCHLGKCCGRGETCVDDQDPDSRHGCCPSDQNVCGGKCCPARYTCCGNECCPPGWFCNNGFCSQSVPFPHEPTPPLPPPPQGPIQCEPGQELCQVSPTRWVCCPPGKECCGARGCQGTCVA
jgi:hypothetical protein